jgi:hypothetical protein
MNLTQRHIGSIWHEIEIKSKHTPADCGHLIKYLALKLPTNSEYMFTSKAKKKIQIQP